MITSFLIYGLFICALIQPEGGQRLAGWVMTVGVIVTDVVYQLGFIEGEGYYLFCAAMVLVIAAALCFSNALMLINKLHTACVAAFVLNAVDWVLYVNTAIINDWLYEGLFVALYLYIWVALLGKGGADVVGRIRQFENHQHCSRVHSRVHSSDLDRR